MGPHDRGQLARTDGHHELAPLVEAARAFAEHARAPRTLAAYRQQWGVFTAWCASHGLAALPATSATIALYLTARATDGRKVATLAQAIAAISEAHKLGGHPSPCGATLVRETWKGIRRSLGSAQRRVAPVLVEDLRAMLARLPATLRGIRDRALLTLGFAGAFRPTELCELEVGDVAFVEDGIAIAVRRSKTDAEGVGATVGIPFGAQPSTCPVRSVRAWLEAAAIVEGRVFRSVPRHGCVGGSLCRRDIARLVKARIVEAGLDPAIYSGHSLRAGLATSAARAGKPDRAIMVQGRWRSRSMVDRYVRDASLFRDNAAAGIGL